MNEINTNLLDETVGRLLAKGKGILAADESNGTADKRLASIEVEGGEENRKKYRDLFLCMPDLEKYVSGVIMYDETFWQKACDGDQFSKHLDDKGVVPGIKVDLGAQDFPGFPGETLTVGLDDLEERARNYFKNGARFSKWRAVIKIDESKGLPTKESIEANADALGRYARIAQEAGLVPIVEPEVLLTGNHSIETAEKITTYVVEQVFAKMIEYRAYVPGVILKTSMIINGNANANEASALKVANATVRMLQTSVPKNVGGVVFLSGGQTAVEATAHLDAIVEKGELPFEIAFSYARALQQTALQIWLGKDENTEIARAEFKKRLELNQLADVGDYDIKMEYLN